MVSNQEIINQFIKKKAHNKSIFVKKTKIPFLYSCDANIIIIDNLLKD